MNEPTYMYDYNRRFTSQQESLCHDINTSRDGETVTGTRGVIDLTERGRELDRQFLHRNEH